jgi:hypothetical protein
MEFFNELMILILSYFTLTFSDFNSNSEAKYQCGWLYFLCLLVMVGVNLLAIIYSEIIARIGKLICKKRKNKKVKGDIY